MSIVLLLDNKKLLTWYCTRHFIPHAKIKLKVRNLHTLKHFIGRIVLHH